MHVYLILETQHNYRTLQIPYCNVSIAVIGNGSVTIFIIVLEILQGYHQVGVMKSDQEKLAFFALDKTKTDLTSCHLNPTTRQRFTLP